MNIFVILLFYFSTLVATNSEINKLQVTGDYKLAEDKLKLLQVEKPFDGEINYNLGVLQYKQGKFSEATENFIRSLQNLDPNIELFNKASFNLANAFYKNTLSILGDSWEKKELDQNVLTSAIQEVKKSINQYEKVIKIDKAKINKQYAEDLLKKLEQKKQNQDKQDKEQKKDQNKDQEKSKDQQNSEKNEQPQSDKSPDQQKKDKENPKNKGDQEKQDQSQRPEEKHRDDQKADDMELKGMRALLENLQSGEEKLQKALINRKIAGNIQQRSDQKNW